MCFPNVTKAMNDLFHRFKDSMIIDYEQWHDGVGYDVSLIAQMSEADRQSVEDLILSGGLKDWRDLETLHVLRTERAWAAIVSARTGPVEELRLAAMDYGPQPDEDVMEEQVLAGLNDPKRMGAAIDSASDCPTHAVKERLIEVARTADLPYGYSAAATLYEIAGLIDSRWDMAHRDFFLRFSAPPGPERDEATAELRKKIDL